MDGVGTHVKSKNGASHTAAATAGRRTRPTPTSLRREIDRLSARVRELEAEKAELERFAAVAAHEMLEPLLITEAYAAVITDRLDEDDAESHLAAQRIGRSASRARLLVETLLHDARTADPGPAFEEVDLQLETTQCIELLAPEIESRGARIVVDDLPRVRGEAVLLSSVLCNLLINALKYGARRGAVIRVGAVRESDFWRIGVTSGGPTIDSAEAHRIFEQFSRARDERRAQGSGLGLAICRRIVERQGGRIGVTAGNGSGNCFYFTVPAA
jgi:signal transduction histidine kinase